jgi:UDP-N-acetylglucosamine/UDP-N-acetylgalactosamine diphosphorylase
VGASAPQAAAERARDALRAAGQERLVAHAATLGEAEEAFLLAAARHPWSELRAAAIDPAPAPFLELRPPQGLTQRRLEGQAGLAVRLARLGASLLAHGRVATLLLAGGQGTRLGVAGPKGCVVLGPEPDRTLYRVHAERVTAARRRWGSRLRFLVLVSAATEAETRAAFEPLGLGPDGVSFLRQGELPCLSAEGEALLAAPGRLATAPDGHGGALLALAESGVLADLVRDGVDALTTTQVDNPLARPFDPVTLGWMVERRLQVATKTVRKRDDAERVGLLARDLDGRHRIVEYTEVRPEAAAELPYGSIASHALSTRWLHDLLAGGWRPPLHRALKRVAHLDADGRLVEPEAPNAWKLERFLFDAFPHAARLEMHEVERAREFAPVKNASGEDSLTTARMLVEEEVRRWHRERGLPEPELPSLRPLEQA